MFKFEKLSDFEKRADLNLSKFENVRIKKYSKNAKSEEKTVIFLLGRYKSGP